MALGLMRYLYVFGPFHKQGIRFYDRTVGQHVQVESGPFRYLTFFGRQDCRISKSGFQQESVQRVPIIHPAVDLAAHTESADLKSAQSHAPQKETKSAIL